MPKQKVDWTRVDWSKQDVVISKDAQCSRERVRQARIQFSAEQPNTKHQRTRNSVRLILSTMDTSNKTLLELAELTGCSAERVAVLLNKMGKVFRRLPPGRLKYDWAKFPENWRDLTDKKIADLIGIGNPVVVTQWRNRHGKIKTKEKPPYIRSDPDVDGMPDPHLKGP